jgi:hypothetical protein
MELRLAAVVLAACCLLAPASPSAQTPDAARDPAPPATEGASLEELKRTLEETLRAQRRLEQRIQALEREKAAHAEGSPEQRRLEERIGELESEAAARESAAAREKERLERRVGELEAEKVAHEDGTRSIIAQTLAGLGSRINQFVDFGGVIEVQPSWEEDFEERELRSIALRTLELQFEVQVTDWARGSFVVEYDDGGDLIFTTTEDDEFSIDRMNVDTAFVTLGDTERFWPYLVVGRMVVPFGISTGDPVADVLNIVDPLTVDVFETKKDALLIGFDFPTPPPRPQVVTEAPAPVKPLVVAPLVARLVRLLGYRPAPPPPPTPVYVELPPARPPFTLGVFFYHGDAFEDPLEEGSWDLGRHMGAMAGYRTKGTCRNYSDGDHSDDPLRWLRVLCPWTLDLGVEFNRSVFDSDFLALQYRAFLGPTIDPADFRFGLEPIGFVPGMAASARTSLGPVSLVAEWNGAIESARFQEHSLREQVTIRPRAWQISLAYQFGWHPSVEAIGAQGTYATVSYSETRDLQGVQRFNPNDFTLALVGDAPRRQLAVGVGEWVLPNLRLAVEYARAWDYSRGLLDSRNVPDTNKIANGIFSQVTFEW